MQAVGRVVMKAGGVETKKTPAGRSTVGQRTVFAATAVEIAAIWVSCRVPIRMQPLEATAAVEVVETVIWVALTTVETVPTGTTRAMVSMPEATPAPPVLQLVVAKTAWPTIVESHWAILAELSVLEPLVQEPSVMIWPFLLPVSK